MRIKIKRKFILLTILLMLLGLTIINESFINQETITETNNEPVIYSTIITDYSNGTYKKETKELMAK